MKNLKEILSHQKITTDQSQLGFPYFGGLTAKEIVSVQPMSVPSGLLFYQEYTSETTTTDKILITKSKKPKIKLENILSSKNEKY